MSIAEIPGRETRTSMYDLGIGVIVLILDRKLDRVGGSGANLEYFRQNIHTVIDLTKADRELQNWGTKPVKNYENDLKNLSHSQDPNYHAKPIDGLDGLVYHHNTRGVRGKGGGYFSVDREKLDARAWAAIEENRRKRRRD